MAIISNGTTIATGGSLSVSASPNLTPNTVGSYGLMRLNTGTNFQNGNDFNPSHTLSGSNMRYANAFGDQSGYGPPSGTWRCMGRSEDGNWSSARSYLTTLWLRIS